MKSWTANERAIVIYDVRFSPVFLEHFTLGDMENWDPTSLFLYAQVYVKFNSHVV